ncbi:DeoR/GlpR family DNA-binding transcription regulator [Geodermatophilus sp. YIM 151500]|uniref:DeoR/GlpR family DNA-binding transcription regulator n=1 Tax=Geodermatophilus sp. YIM 151500 TaxID=2984531 RepID=UPI0021E500C6|nr:DeoR/GlpR family DNA-binding transcription regulator [Geodermatophilus sp. YIM 151500]MCV2490296.1 DeoR/GlpR family DNA-binding transcription regulator [Geodermatophilus sp. YIM 151500]
MTDTGLRSEAAAGRRAWILTNLQTVGFLSVADLARQLGVSQMTIRRDLHTLEGAGRVRLVHGGASLTPGALRTSAFPDDELVRARERVATHAVHLVDGADTIAIDAGATGYAIARLLPEEFAGCVISHSMPVLQFLTSGRSYRVVALGGELLPDRQAFVGPTTEAAVAQLRVRTFFVSPAGIDARGLYARTPAEASVQRRLMDIADEVVVVATHDAFSTSAPARIAPLERLATLVTDRRPPGELGCALRRVGVVPHVMAG